MKYEFRVSFDSVEEREAFKRAFLAAAKCLFATNDRENSAVILSAYAKCELVESTVAPINNADGHIAQPHDYDCGCVDCDIDDDYY